MSSAVASRVAADLLLLLHFAFVTFVVLSLPLILVGGLLLLTPGFFTDALGFSFLIPLSRELWRKALSAWLEKQVRQGSVTIRRF